jgi:hypothetical protein
VNPFENPVRKERFFAELTMLIQRYPEFASCMARNFQDDPPHAAHPSLAYDPGEPVMLSGLVLITHHSNLSNYSDLATVTPDSQDYFLTMGMLQSATECW